jgi:hypothetical protein
MKIEVGGQKITPSRLAPCREKRGFFDLGGFDGGPP